jgi:hypothetical protein
MRSKAHIIGLVIGILVTPVLLGLAAFSGGAGHGDYLLARILFPVTMISTLVFGSITVPFIVLAVGQYPIYGWFIGSALRSSHRKLGLWLVLTVHMSTLTLNFVIPNASFGR